MESLTEQREPSIPQAAAAGANSSASPRLVLLPPYGEHTDDFSVVADADTTSAASCTSTGRRFRVSFGFVPSPDISSFCYSWEDPDPQVDDRRAHRPVVIAAHGDCVLLEVRMDYFLYQAMDTGRPSSLLLLPVCYIPTMAGCMLQGETGLLQRGKDDVLVAKLQIPEKEAMKLCLLRLSGDLEWQLKRVPIVVGSRDNDRQDYNDPLRWWCTDAAFAVGDRFLCCVDFLRGFLFVDMAADESSLRLRYVPLPIEPPSGNPQASGFGRLNMRWKRNLAPAGDGSVRFVDVDYRRDPGRSTSCERGQYLFTVTTWTMKLSMDELIEWVKGGMLDCSELWAQPGYMGLPRVIVEYPIVVNSDDPDTVCFVVKTYYHRYSTEVLVKKVWTIEVDTRRKVLRSIVACNGSGSHHPRWVFPAKIMY